MATLFMREAGGTRRTAGGLLAAALLGAAAACAPSIEATEALEVTDLTTGWYDAGIVEMEKNKLVPSASFKLRNVSDETLGSFQINAVFRRLGEADELGNAFLLGVGRGGLDPSDQTDLLTLRSPFGYTGEQPRAEILAHRDFVDAEVEIFVKYGSAQWATLARYPIERQLLTR